LSRPGAALRVGGVTPFTSIDCPGKLAAVVFVQGCPWRCGYCHNPHLQPRVPDRGLRQASWPDTLSWLRGRAGLLDAVVFSGGEPTIDSALPDAIADVRALGFSVGLHTAGIYPRRLSAVLPSLGWIGVDVKAPLADATRYGEIVGARGDFRNVRDSVQRVLDSGVPCEFRTTTSREWLDDDDLLKIASGLVSLGATTFALQLARPVALHDARPQGPAGTEYPKPATLDELGRMFSNFILRLP